MWLKSSAYTHLISIPAYSFRSDQASRSHLPGETAAAFQVRERPSGNCDLTRINFDMAGTEVLVSAAPRWSLRECYCIASKATAVGENTGKG